ncbi:MAG: sigma-70 family RNA polymerase sigma factor [Lachnospiraceae bacterium]|nr:sigma-70 family RNA polymerase sigma factor [Lachnospiraceae bacterium]
MDLELAYDRIYRYAYFRLGERAAAEDITQEAFLRFLGKYGQLREYDMRILYTIARNLCIDEYRRIKPEALPEETAEVPGLSVDGQEERILVRDALSKLPAEERELLLLRYVNDESPGTIGKLLKLSRFAVYRRLKTAEEHLRKEMEAEG